MAWEAGDRAERLLLGSAPAIHHTLLWLHMGRAQPSVSPGMLRVCCVPPRHSLLQELLQAADLEHKVLDVDAVQLVVRVAQRLVDEQVHSG